MVQVLKARKAGKITVSEVASGRRAFAERFGANLTLDPAKDDIVSKVHEFCDGDGADVAFDAAGVQAGVDVAVLAIRARGTIVNVACWDKPATIMPNSFVYRNVVMLGQRHLCKEIFRR